MRRLKPAVAMLAPIALGLLGHWAGAWVVSHDLVNYDLDVAGLGCLSDMAELATALGAVGSILAAEVFMLPAVIASVRGVGPTFKAFVLNGLAIPIFFCFPSSPDFVFAVRGLLTTVLWIVAVIWAATQPVENTQSLSVAPNDDTATRLGTSEVTKGPPAVS